MIWEKYYVTLLLPNSGKPADCKDKTAEESAVSPFLPPTLLFVTACVVFQWQLEREEI